MQSLIRFIKTSSIYLVGNVLIKAVAFFMLPIYTKYLNPTDYGTYDVNIAYITFLSSVLFLDVWSGILRFMFDYTKNDDKKKPILSGIIIFCFSTIAYAIFTFTLGQLMSIKYLFWVFLYGLTANLQQLLAYIVRGFSKNALFAISGFIGSAITMVFDVIFIAFMHTGYEYLYIASIIGAIVNSIILFWGVNLKSIIHRENYSRALTRNLLVFSLPLTINSISWWFLTAFNRVVLSNQLSLAANGLYAVANKFSSIVQLIDQAFQMAWQEISFAKGGSNDEDKGAFFSSAINEYMKFMILGISLLLPFIKIVFPYFVNKTYEDAFKVIPLALIATVLSSISYFLGGTLTAIKKNRYLFTTTLAGTFVNIIVIELTIGKLQVQAASLALGLGYLIVDLRRYSLLKKYIGLKISFLSILIVVICLTASTAVFLLGGNLANSGLLLVLVMISVFLYKDYIAKFLKKND